MKKVLLAAVAFVVIGMSSCKKEETAKPEAQKESVKVAAKDLGTFD